MRSKTFAATAVAHRDSPRFLPTSLTTPAPAPGEPRRAFVSQASRLRGPPFRNSRESVSKKLGRWGCTEFKYWIENQYSVTHNQPNQMVEGEPGEVLEPLWSVEAEDGVGEDPMLGRCSMSVNHPLIYKSTHARGQVNDLCVSAGHRLRGDRDQMAPRQCAWDVNVAMSARLPHSGLFGGSSVQPAWPVEHLLSVQPETVRGQGRFCLDLILGVS